MPRKRSKIKKHRESAIPEWQLAFLRTGKLEWDPIFEEIENEDLWPTDIHPDPWEMLHFSTYGAGDLWQRVRGEIDMESFPYTETRFLMKKANE